MVCEGDAEDGELRGREGLCAPPEESKRAFGGVDVAGGLPGEQLAVAAMQALATCAVRRRGHVGKEIGPGIAAGEVRRGALLGGQAEEQRAGVLGGKAISEEKKQKNVESGFSHVDQRVNLVQYKGSEKRG